MSRRNRPIKTNKQIRNKQQVALVLGELEKDRENFRLTIGKKDEQLQKLSRILTATKTVYQKIHKENIELRNHILNQRKNYKKRKQKQKQQLYQKQYEQHIEEQEESKNSERNENESDK